MNGNGSNVFPVSKEGKTCITEASLLCDDFINHLRVRVNVLPSKFPQSEVMGQFLARA